LELEDCRMTEDRCPAADPDAPDSSPVSRRSVLRGAVALGVVGLGGTLSACGGGNSGTASPEQAPSGSAPPSSTPTSSAPTPTTSTRSATPAATSPTPAASHTAKKASAKPAAPTGARLGPSSEIPVGGGKIFEKQKVVVTQPTKGEFHGFSAVCTHQSCILADCDGGTINCGCHASKFDLKDGHVLTPPATKPLVPVKITVADGQVIQG
jgi:nitrite reductase/ring-hydroxylating ferredoxin subunit